MGTYVVKVEIDPFWVAKYNKDKTSLCISHGVDDGSAGGASTNFNIVTSTEIVADNVFFTWTDAYRIAACRQSFKNGDSVQAVTDTEAIKFQQSVLLTDVFQLKPAVDDKTLGEGTFLFENKVMASVLLYKDSKVEGKNVSSPFYMSANGPLGPGKDKLTPKVIARFYFGNKVETGTMIDEYMTETCDVDLTGKKSAVISYDKEGHWQIISIS